MSSWKITLVVIGLVLLTTFSIFFGVYWLRTRGKCCAGQSEFATTGSRSNLFTENVELAVGD